MATAEDLRAELASLLANPDDPEASGQARSLLDRQFEDEAIFGPVSEVVSELSSADLVRLCGLALAHDEPALAIARDWAVARIADNVKFVTERELLVLAEIAGSPPLDSLATHEGLGAHLDALRAWAVLEDDLPPWTGTEVEPAQRTWRLIDELVFHLLKNRPFDAGRSWAELLGVCRHTAVDALVQMSAPSGWSFQAHSAYPLLADTYSSELRGLYEWALDNWSQVTPATGRFVRSTPQALVRELGRLGDSRTRALLESHLDDPDLSTSIMAAIGAIEARHVSG
jgi:hypothetical protein